jgi:hypothetical protein
MKQRGSQKSVINSLPENIKSRETPDLAGLCEG